MPVDYSFGNRKSSAGNIAAKLGISQTIPFVDNSELRKVVAHNLRRLMDQTPGLDTQEAVAKKAVIAQSHVSKILRCQANATLDLIAALGRAFNVLPWELLAEDESTRKAALERMLFGLTEPHREAPRKEVAHRRRKKGGKIEGDPAH